MSHKVTVIGDGGWGTALAMVLNRNGHQVTIWGHDQDYIEQVRERQENFKYLPGVNIDPSISWSANRDQVSANTDAFVIAVPSKFYQPVLTSFHGMIPPSSSVISVSKGLLDDRRLSDWAAELLGIAQVAALSGPSHAEEVAYASPSAVTVASPNTELADFFQELFNSPRFRVYTSQDIVGVELGGALKNVIAIAAGISDGLGFGDNTKAALITRGLAELVRLGVAAGGKPETFVGLSGVGDLMVTCGSQHSRNRGVGERLGKGETMAEIEATMTMIAEGVFNAKTAKHLADSLNVEAPITTEVYKIIYEGGSPSESMESLLSRDPKPE
ncbi:NAD(P)-dependent glycerol-3-phosphate dehydrogenase [Kiritimatiellota bacterium B12222]|nr:NAD(P)-dependent glycerol-3-phosphate dehydrogenase [Kiritimatiellota bacterium B12222]